ncbi:glycoside hydrolase family 44 protein [Paenibacillus sp. GD4]|uniref:glycoside hydrolase family 44 protein n=1 Tax=Paenibacillus sp. GD4 TaxID=3068890 RepID=UPI0027969228|nr:glycoside hydrolase family 44 protein [Paenibacillus sp. GD4]MDQ1912819.1 glycoside hydrolase family 44 protein [Paenibacillus sp. GD4]
MESSVKMGKKVAACLLAFPLMLGSISPHSIGGSAVAVAAAAVDTAVAVQPGSAPAGSAVKLDAKVTVPETAALLVDVEIFDASLKKVHQMFKDNISVKAGVPATVPFEWTLPAGLPEGKYIVSMGVFGTGWSSMYKWHAGAAELTVTKGVPTLTFTSNAGVTPAQAQPGTSVQVDASVVASVYSQALVELSLVDPSGAKAMSQTFLETFEASQVKRLAANWNVPANAPEGVYQVAVDVQKPDRTAVYHHNAQAGQFTVGSVQQPSLPAPANLKAVPGETQVALTWDAITDSNVMYEVEADGTIVDIITGTSYTHSGLQPDTAHSYRVRAKSSHAVGLWSSEVKAKTAPAVSKGSLQVNIKTGTNASTQQPSPGIEIYNISKNAIELKDVKARYYFTIDGEKPLSLGFWTTAVKDQVTTAFVKMPIPSANADHYLEIGFKENAGTLQPGSKVGVYTWLNKSDWSSFKQTDDYSFNGSSESVANEKATGYRLGQLDWGKEPTLLDMPAFPSNIKAVPDETSILWTWDAVEGATGYDVDADGSITENVQGNEFLSQWLRPGTRHNFKVRARKGDKLSLWSSALTVKTTGEQILPAPENVRAKASQDAITVTWNQLQEEITGYDIEVDGSVMNAGTATTYNHTGLAQGTSHTYRVRAMDGTTTGAWSSPLKLNTLYVPTGKFTVNFTVDTEAQRAPISPYIYGTNDDLTGTENWGSRRQGGNRMSTYNWENNASNAGDDYFHRSDNYVPWYYGGIPWGGNMDDPGIGVSGFHQKSQAMGAYTLTTLQTAGYVAADKNGEVSSAETAPSSRWKQVQAAKGAPFSLTPDLTDDKVYMDEFVNLLVNKHGNASTPTGIKGYAIDNEPSLWKSTHPHMHPAKPGSAEVLNKGIELAKAVKHVDPYAEMFGPVAYSFDEMYSMHAADDWESVKGNYRWYADYYLDKFRIASEQENKRLLDVFDFHWYPEISAGGYRITDSGSNDKLEANLARMQAPRSLWDPSYTEDSWIGQWYSSFLPVIPRLQQSIDEYNPGTKIAITEYNYGGENNVYGGIAHADVLGIFGKYGVYLANFWKMVNNLEDAPYVTAAFKIFNNYDGGGARFGDTKVKAETSNIENSSIYGSVFKDSDNKLHLIVMNKNNDHAMNAVLNIAGSTQYKSARVWAFDGTSPQITEREGISRITGNSFTYEVPKLTVAHIVLSAE